MKLRRAMIAYVLRVHSSYRRIGESILDGMEGGHWKKGVQIWFLLEGAFSLVGLEKSRDIYSNVYLLSITFIAIRNSQLYKSSIANNWRLLYCLFWRWHIFLIIILFYFIYSTFTFVVHLQSWLPFKDNFWLLTLSFPIWKQQWPTFL